MQLFKPAIRNIIYRQFCLSKILKQTHEATFDKLLEAHIDKILYNTHLYRTNPKFNFWRRVELKKREKQNREQLQSVQPLPRVLRYFYDDPLPHVCKETKPEQPEKEHIQTHFPFANQTISISDGEDVAPTIEMDAADRTKHEIERRQHSLWMHDYENYEDDADFEGSDWTINYGTPDPRSSISRIPCGGCGALLHCKDTAIPGYLPSEIFKNAAKREGVDLKALICQRCHFLKYYNLALQVRVTSDDYIKVLESLKTKRALILLTVDLFDFPCSLWPGIVDVLGQKQPIVIVGNKVDLIPRDSPSYLDRIKSVVSSTVRETVSERVARNVKHVTLISAKTGWGVEELITKLHNIWNTRGDVYVVGCTNVGKSSLFNCLLQSDFCKVQAVDLIQRATTSVWPGTTMNMLKFPILRPSGWRMFVRMKRLQALNKIRAEENKLNVMRLKETREMKYATLVGHIDRTFRPGFENAETGSDVVPMMAHPNTSGGVCTGINENDPVYVASKWCYDTPGVEHPEQIIHLLTTEELTLALPRDPIQPKTFSIRLGQTVFIAGLARLDYCSGPHSIKITVFCSELLPITMCYTEDASSLYETFLGSEIFLVPKGSPERLSKWPNLKQGELLLHLQGVNEDTSCGDIVLSNAGWISVTCASQVAFKAWTPEGRGIYVRKCLLPFAVALRGKKIHHSPAYASDKCFLPK
ncbi:nitric oxide-associated protein 1 [Photinus pyralis]|uniref:nitric oxide-associated protein 1 n=1 Tax=Photinus pyralis TaxID=7054 RepID=UPI0012674BC5|nr:nitric oxide-associated protein 1 [Photinus pyralis]